MRAEGDGPAKPDALYVEWEPQEYAVEQIARAMAIQETLGIGGADAGIIYSRRDREILVDAINCYIAWIAKQPARKIAEWAEQMNNLSGNRPPKSPTDAT